jgi:hypothetical protein
MLFLHIDHKYMFLGSQSRDSDIPLQLLYFVQKIDANTVQIMFLSKEIAVVNITVH